MVQLLVEEFWLNTNYFLAFLNVFGKRKVERMEIPFWRTRTSENQERISIDLQIRNRNSINYFNIIHILI